MQTGEPNVAQVTAYHMGFRCGAGYSIADKETYCCLGYSIPDIRFHCGPGYSIPDMEIIAVQVTASIHWNLWLLARLQH